MARALREEFLERAACSMVSSSPSTSAFVMAEKLNTLADSRMVSTPATRAICCFACGSLFVPGWTASQARESFTTSYRTVKRGAEPVRQAVHKSVVHECQTCHRKTVISFQKPAKLKRPSSTNTNEPVPAKIPPQGSSSAKSTAKQRAKDRKSKQGLQALLLNSRSKQNTTASIPPSLDLMDFMK